MEKMVFTYGTLRRYGVRQMIPGNHEVVADATLRGFSRETDIRLSMNPDGVVEGQILMTDSLRSIDDYEGVDSGVYHRVLVPTETGDEIWLYHFGNNREATDQYVKNGEAAIEVTDE